MAVELAKVLSPMVGNTHRHVRNSQDFANKIMNISLFPSESDIMVSLDVRALFTSVPVDKAITHIRNCLENDLGLEERTDLSPITIVSLLQFCINTTYFLYDDAFYQQRSGAAMGSPVSPVVANLYMEWFEQEALSSYCDTAPKVWFRYVDDTLVIISSEDFDNFFNHINSIDSIIHLRERTR